MMKKFLGVVLTVTIFASLLMWLGSMKQENGDAASALRINSWRSSSSGVASGQTIEEVEQALIASSESLKSYEADMTISGDVRMEGSSMVTTGYGHMEFKQEGGKQYSRKEMKTSTVTTMSGQETSMDSTSLIITDGEFAYMLMDSMGQKMASKSKLPATSAGAAHEDMFKALAETNNLKVLPSESVEGEDACVIEITPKEGGARAGASTMFYAKKNGMWLKTITLGPEGKPILTVSLTNIKVNGDIDQSRFDFVPPAGVEVSDMTQY